MKTDAWKNTKYMKTDAWKNIRYENGYMEEYKISEINIKTGTCTLTQTNTYIHEGTQIFKNKYTENSVKISALSENRL